MYHQHHEYYIKTNKSLDSIGTNIYKFHKVKIFMKIQKEYKRITNLLSHELVLTYCANIIYVDLLIYRQLITVCCCI